MPKHQQEIRDPIHNFVRATADEALAINSRPFQRLRHIHQLALTYLVYPENQFGSAAVRSRIVPPKQQSVDFPVILDSGDISTSIAESTIYADFKPAAVGFVFISPEKRKDAEKWLAANKQQVLTEQMEFDL